MQLASDTALAAAVDAPQRIVVSELKFDWGRTGLYDHVLSDLSSLVDDLTLQRDNIGTLPQETTTLEGFVGGTLSVQLSGRLHGQTDSIARLLSPLNSSGPLYGQARQGIAVKWRLGLVTTSGTVPMMDQFTGEITGFEVTSDRVVQIACTDMTNRLHTAINLPIFSLTRQFPGTTSQNRYRINSQWVIDYILRRNGIYQSPPAPATAIYSATGHGSMIPEVGHQFDYLTQYGSCAETDPVVTAGRWGLAYTGAGKSAPVFNARTNGSWRALPGTSWLIQLQADLSKAPIQLAPSMVLLSSGRGLFLGTTVDFQVNASGRLSVVFYADSTLTASVNGPTLGTAGWTDCWVEIKFGSSLSNSTVNFPGLSVTGVNLSGLSSSPAIWSNSMLANTVAVPMQALQISETTNTGLVTYDPAFVSQCDLDAGLNEFFSLPVRRNKDSLELLKEVIAAEFGVAGFSESGRFYFRNRNTVRRNNLTVEKTVSADTNLTMLRVGERPGSVRNTVTARVQEQYRDGTKYETIWETREANEILAPIGASLWRVTLNEPAQVRDEDGLVYTTTANWDVEGQPDTHIFSAVDVLTNAEINLVSIDVLTNPTQLAAGVDEVILSITNNHTSYVYFKTTDGRPALRIGGQPAHDGPEQGQTFQRQTSITQFGTQLYPLDNNDWRQSLMLVQPIALNLLEDLKQPVPYLSDITLVGDPRLQLLDTLDLGDVQGLGGPVWVNVEAITRRLSGSKLEDTLTVRMFTTPGRWILGHPTLSVLGQTTILG